MRPTFTTHSFTTHLRAHLFTSWFIRSFILISWWVAGTVLDHSLYPTSLSAWVVLWWRPVILGGVTEVVLTANLTFGKLIWFDFDLMILSFLFCRPNQVHLYFVSSFFSCVVVCTVYLVNSALYQLSWEWNEGKIMPRLKNNHQSENCRIITEWSQNCKY